MYQIFNNEKCLQILKHKPSTFVKGSVCVSYTDDENIIKDTVRLFMSDKAQAVYLITPYIHKAFEALKKYFKIIEAAGGLVFNNKSQLLMIHRLGMWDLPKGKIESGESKRSAAIREVEEECGLSKLRIERFCTTTYHIYFLKDKPILKYSHWYRMKCNDTTTPQPQFDEGISKVVWANKKQISLNAASSYATIRLLLQSKMYV